MAIPSMRGLKSLEMEQVADPPGARTRAAQGWGVFRGLAFSLGMLLLAICLGLLGWSGAQLRNLKKYRVDETEKVVEFNAAQLDTLLPEQLLDEWLRMSHDGLVEGKIDIRLLWIEAERVSEPYRKQQYAGFLVGGCGLVLILGALLIPRLGGRATAPRAGRGKP